MTIPVWPETLPAQPLADRYQETLPETTVRTAMEQGPAKLRQRTTAGVGQIEVAYLLSAAQGMTLEDFYRTTLGGGSLPFSMAHPRRGDTATLRFRKAPVLTPRPGGYVMARVELEVLP